ncbi:MAG TPA: glutamyl-tRNA reductase [Acidimicrobiales bacterium]|jgi:glutamyl-tRNA reductase|nr:glutamyl-tRNA reductase [Acidimicrobiales bacterium]
MAVISVGVDHEHASLALLAEVTIPEDDLHKVLAELTALEDVGEVVVVSTCLRTEVYAVIERFHGALDGITGVLAGRAGVESPELAPSITVHFDRGVPAHLFSVAAGLRSAVPGETEVLGQVRRALERAIDEGSAGPELTELFRHALTAGRRARSETGIARGTTSFAHATIAMAADDLGTLDDTLVVVIGAGQLASGVLDGLLEGRRGVPRRIVIANRTPGTAHALADRDPARVAAIGLDELGGALVGADLVVAAVESSHPIVTAELLGRVGGPVLVIDLGMPKCVAPDALSLSGVRFLDLAHLRDVVDAAMHTRRGGFDAAEQIVTDEVERHLEHHRTRGAAPLVTSLRAWLESLRAAELEGLSNEDRAIADRVTRSLVAKIAHEPTVALRESSGTERGQRLADATRALFDL